MTAERWRQIEDIFTQAMDFPLPERARFLSRVCQGDEELRREVESLLACDAPDRRLIEVPRDFDGSSSLDDESAPDMAGRRIGTYRLIRLIGYGGPRRSSIRVKSRPRNGSVEQLPESAGDF